MKHTLIPWGSSKALRSDSMLNLLDQNAAIDTRLYFLGNTSVFWTLMQITHEKTMKLRLIST